MRELVSSTMIVVELNQDIASDIAAEMVYRRWIQIEMSGANALQFIGFYSVRYGDSNTSLMV